MLQSIWYQINHGQEIFVVGTILDDNTVKGGTGWGAEFAKLCNKPLYVFDQARNQWFTWNQQAWVPSGRRTIAAHPPSAFHRHRHAAARGQRQARHRRTLFERSFEADARG